MFVLCSFGILASDETQKLLLSTFSAATFGSLKIDVARVLIDPLSLFF
jgi:hypothetical protein